MESTLFTNGYLTINLGASNMKTYCASNINFIDDSNAELDLVVPVEYLDELYVNAVLPNAVLNCQFINFNRDIAITDIKETDMYDIIGNSPVLNESIKKIHVTVTLS